MNRSAIRTRTAEYRADSNQYETEGSESQLSGDSGGPFLDMFQTNNELDPDKVGLAAPVSPARSIRYIPQETSSDEPESTDDDTFYVSKVNRRQKRHESRNVNKDETCRLSLSSVDLGLGTQLEIPENQSKRFRGRKITHAQTDSCTSTSDTEDDTLKVKNVKLAQKKPPTKERNIIRHRGRRYRFAGPDARKLESAEKVPSVEVQPCPPSRKKIASRSSKYRTPPKIDIISPSPTLSTTSSSQDKEHDAQRMLNGDYSMDVAGRPNFNKPLPLLKMVLGAATVASAKHLHLQPPNLEGRPNSSSSGSISPASSMRCTSSYSTSSDCSNSSPLPPLKNKPVIRRRNLLPPIVHGDSSTSSRNSSPASIDSPIHTPIGELLGWARPLQPDGLQQRRNFLDSSKSAPRESRTLQRNTLTTSDREDTFAAKDGGTASAPSNSRRKSSHTSPSRKYLRESKLRGKPNVSEAFKACNWTVHKNEERRVDSELDSTTSMDVVAPSSPPSQRRASIHERRLSSKGESHDVRFPQLVVTGSRAPVGMISPRRSSFRANSLIKTPLSPMKSYSFEDHTATDPAPTETTRAPKRNTAPLILSRRESQSSKPRALGGRLLKRRIASCEENDPALREFRRTLRSFSIDAPPTPPMSSNPDSPGPSK